MKGLTVNELRKLCSIAKTASIQAGKYIQSQLDTHQILSNKDSETSLAAQIVTEVDLESQEMILKYLGATIETHDLGLLTEEAFDDRSRAKKDYFWCIDPMDGTLAFTEGRAGYAVSIALVSQDGDPLIGVVYVPDTEQCYSSVKGDGVLLNDQPFTRKENTTEDDAIQVFLDRSFQAEKYYPLVQSYLKAFASKDHPVEVDYHVSFGAVRNALGVLTSNRGCYFKFPKKQKGGGSIWDFAATRLLFEELGLWVSNVDGHLLHLNNLNTAYMNEVGVLYATHGTLAKEVMKIRKGIETTNST